MVGISELKRLFRRSKRWLVDGVILQGRRSRFSDKLIIETTNRCSLRCACCPNGNNVALRRQGIMSREVFDRVLANLDIPVKVCFLHMCGEPFLNPDLEYFCRRLMERKIIPTIFSNGYNINPDLLDKVLKVRGIKISFSMEIHSREEYESIRVPASHAKAQTCLEEIERHFSAAKKFYGLNVILRGNHDAGSVKEISRILFGRYPRLSNITFSSEWPWPGLPQTGDLAGHMTAHNSMCNQAKSLPAILWDGRVSFCNLDYSGEMIVGNAADTGFSQLVNNRESRRFRRRLAMRSVPGGSICSRCVLPRYNSFTLNITRGKMRTLMESGSTDYFYPADEYFRN